MTMVRKFLAFQLGGASVLAIGASLFAGASVANACEATTTGGSGTPVQVFCSGTTPTVQPFETSYSTDSDTYDGNGVDSLNVTHGASILSSGANTPNVNNLTGVYLDPSTDVIDMNDGDDIVDISGGTIGGTATTGDFISIQLGAGNDSLTMIGGVLNGNIYGDEGDAVGNDEININGGFVNGSIYGSLGNDLVNISGDGRVGLTPFAADFPELVDSIGLEDGDDRFTMSGGIVDASVSGGGGEDYLGLQFGAFVGGDLSGGDDDDDFYMDDQNTDGTRVDGGMFGQAGNDQFNLAGGSIGTDVDGGTGADQFFIRSGTTVSRDVRGGDDADQIYIGQVGLGEGFVNRDVMGDAGADVIQMIAGTVGRDIDGGSGNDQLTILGGVVIGNVLGGLDADTITVSGGEVNGSVNAGAEAGDAVAVSGGTISGDVYAASVTLTGGTILGDIRGIGPNTLIINAPGSNPVLLDLADNVLFEGLGNANAAITNTELAFGGTERQRFTGFDTVGVDNSTLAFCNCTIGVSQLNLVNTSTLYVNGNATTLQGNLSMDQADLDMQDGAADDVFTLGGLVIQNSDIRVDVDQASGTSDRVVATSVAASGVNRLHVNLLGIASYATPTIVSILAANGVTSATFGDPIVTGGDALLFDYDIVDAPGGGLQLVIAPRTTNLAAPRNAVDVSVVENAVSTLRGIVNDALDADLRLAHGAQLVPISPTFGVFASGQLAHTEHDGYTIGGASAGPAFDADDFSAAISLDWNAAKHFQFDNEYGLNIGFFGGYASTDVDLGPLGLGGLASEGTNNSGLFGTYALFRRNTTYALVAAQGFLGETDLVNGVSGSTGTYDTKGFAMTGSVGRIFAIGERMRFDLRGGLLGVSFTGDAFTDSAGIDYGKSHLSFGAVKFEPGIYGDFKLENGMVFSPYARADLQQRFGYKNTTEIAGQRVSFDDADFSAALSTGFNLRMSPTTTVSGEVRGKWSADSSTIGGKLGLKLAF